VSIEYLWSQFIHLIDETGFGIDLILIIALGVLFGAVREEAQDEARRNK